MNLLKPFLPYLLGGCAFMTLASGLIAWWAWDERDEAQDARKRAETALEAERELRRAAGIIKQQDASTASEIAALRREFQSIDFTGEPVYVTAPTPDCPSTVISGSRLRDKASRGNALLLRAGSRSPDGEAGPDATPSPNDDG